jgi:hypothetical protein
LDYLKGKLRKEKLLEYVHKKLKSNVGDKKWVANQKRVFQVSLGNLKTESLVKSLGPKLFLSLPSVKERNCN